MTSRTHLGLAFAATLLVSAPLVAQQTPRTSTPPEAPQSPASPTAPASDSALQEFPDANVTFQELRRLLRQLPPAVGEVLSRDPSLLNRPDYLAPYPALVAFLQRHPEVARNPSFFFDSFQFREPDPRSRSIDLFENILGGIAAGTGLIALASVFVWLVRTIVEHRRWLRLSRVQVEVHSKLLDRLQSNEDLLAYMQTPAGRRFLEAAPITLDGELRPGGAPLNRIVLSLQAGVVLIAVGIGLRFIEWDMVQEVAEGFRVIGIIAIALGIGFAASAVVAYMVSARLGLIVVKKPEESSV
jgi:hypothetical protein